MEKNLMKLGKLSTTPVKFLLKISILDFFLALGKCLGTKGAPTPTCGLSNRSDYPKVDFFTNFFSPKHSKREKTNKKRLFSFDSNIFIISGFLQNATLPKGFGVNSTGNFLDL